MMYLTKEASHCLQATVNIYSKSATVYTAFQSTQSRNVEIYIFHQQKLIHSIKENINFLK